MRLEGCKILMSSILRDIIRNWDAKDIRNLVVTILALVIPIYFQKIIGFTANIVSEFSNSLSTQFVDRLYRDASGNPIAITSLIIFSMLYAMPLFISILNRASLKPSSSASTASRNIIQNYLSRQSRAFLIFFVIFFAICSIMLFVIAITTVSVPLLAYIDFNQKVLALTPYMTDQERNLVISRWAFMTTKKEYTIIISDLNTIAAAHGLKLSSGF